MEIGYILAIIFAVIWISFEVIYFIKKKNKSDKD